MLRFSLTIVLACATALAGSAVAPATAAQPDKLPKIDFRQRTLANGMRVFSVEDHSTPTVSIQVWYHVGSKDDPEGRSGFAHLFEHLMFKATKNMKDETMDRLTEDVGGENNAYTADDMTVYFEVVPSNYLETLLWAEADRLATLNVNDKNFPSERDVVKEEYRQRYAANPYGNLLLAMEKKSWAAHPYKRPGIGNIEELNAATLADVVKFHETYYRSDNATLVVVGDFDPKQLDAWVDKYFTPIAKPAGEIPRVTIKEPARAGEKRYAETGPNVPLPGVILTYQTVPVADDDAFALQVAEAIMAGGESSRLYQSLVYQKQLLSEISAGNDLREDGGMFVFFGVLASNKKLEDAEAAIYEEIKRMQDAPVSAAELEKAKNQIVTAQLLNFETNNGKADMLGKAAVILKDPNRVNTDVERLQKVTAADIQRVMQKYLTQNNRVVITYTQAAQAGGGDGK
jgi:zinc protease